MINIEQKKSCIGKHPSYIANDLVKVPLFEMILRAKGKKLLKLILMAILYFYSVLSKLFVGWDIWCNFMY